MEVVISRTSINHMCFLYFYNLYLIIVKYNLLIYVYNNISM